jgi:peptidyl-Lys metalloendopeptidase
MALFQASVFSDSTYSSNQPVKITFRLTNLSQDTMRVLKWFTPLEGLWSDCLLVIRDGQRVLYDGPLAKRGIPTAEDFITLASGESAEREVAVYDAYQVSLTGTYSLSVETEIQALPAEELRKFASEALDQRLMEGSLFERAVRQPIPHAATNFVVVGIGPSIETAGERVRKQLLSVAAKFELRQTTAGTALPPKFIGGTQQQQTDAGNAHFDGYKLAQAALAGLQNDNVYAEWFGVNTQTRFQSVRDHYAKIVNDIEQKEFTYDLTGTGCQSGVYAYTYKGSTTIWTCDQFWASASIGIDSKAGTVVHEHSHASAGTDDLAYGQGGCRQLAINDPDKAIRNADSHEYYAKG